VNRRGDEQEEMAMRVRKIVGTMLLVVAALPISEYLFFNQRLRPEEMKAEEILLGQFWSIAVPILVISGLLLICWTPITSWLRTRRT
jgi:hypothetical protein